MDKVTLIGFGTVGKVVMDLFESEDRFQVESIVVSRGFESTIPEHMKNLVIPWSKFVDGRPRNFFVCIGYQDLNKRRQEIFLEALGAGHNPINFVHSRSFLSRSASLGKGTLIMPSVTVENNVSIGDGTFLWSGTVVGHDSCIGDFSFISANVSIGGEARLGSNCVVGLGSVIGNRVTVGDKSLLGACVLTTSSIPEDSVVIRGSDRVIEMPSHEFLKLTNFDHVN